MKTLLNRKEIDMTPEIKDMKTWAEAERWLAKHGYGLAQIEEQKILWEAAKTVKQAPVAAAPKPATKAVEKPAAKAVEKPAAKAVEKPAAAKPTATKK